MLPLFFAVAAAIAPGPVAPPPSVKLTLAAAGPDTEWTMRVENTGSVPYLLAADARLLVLDVTPPGSSAPVRCALPQDMRPDGDGGRALVVPPQRAYKETIDPRMYCFGPRERAALVPGATVAAHLGWPEPQKGKPRRAPIAPFVITPLDGVEPRVAAAKEISAAPSTLPPSLNAGGAAAAPSTPPAIAPSADPAAAPEDTLSLHVAPTGDSSVGSEVTTTVTITNDGTRAATLLFRMATLSFDVGGPTGSRRCGDPPNIDSPIRELFTTLAPRARATMSVLLGELCPEGTFDAEGLYTVRPVADTRHASGKSIGLRTFDGLIIGHSPQVMRVRHPKRAGLPRRPVLE